MFHLLLSGYLFKHLESVRLTGFADKSVCALESTYKPSCLQVFLGFYLTLDLCRPQSYVGTSKAYRLIKPRPPNMAASFSASPCYVSGWSASPTQDQELRPPATLVPCSPNTHEATPSRNYCALGVFCVPYQIKLAPSRSKAVAFPACIALEKQLMP